MRHHAIGLGGFPIEIDPCILIVAPGQLSRFGKSLGQISVAVLLVAFTLAFTVAGPLCWNFSTVRHVVTDFGEQIDSRNRHNYRLVIWYCGISKNTDH